jgi:hypothetical protein
MAETPPWPNSALLLDGVQFLAWLGIPLHLSTNGPGDAAESLYAPGQVIANDACQARVVGLRESPDAAHVKVAHIVNLVLQGFRQG